MPSSRTGGGVIQIVHYEGPSTFEPSTYRDPLSRTLAPRVNEPKPNPGQPRHLAVSEAVEPAREESVTPLPRPRTEPEQEAQVPVQPEPEVIKELEPTPIESEGLLTSESSSHTVVVEEVKELEPVEIEVEEAIVVESLPEEIFEDQGSSGSGTEDTAGVDEEAGQQGSGEGDAPVAPPAPPPVPSGSSLFGGGRAPVYPKRAYDDGAEGVVWLEIYVSASGELLDVKIKESSGDTRLDQQALLSVKSNYYIFESATHDYLLVMGIPFEIGQEVAGEPLFGETEWVISIKEE
ncbi:MAG: TonB family protein [Firmicutes bacterium]|nr:TonB family protein [Bacillota bacterium]